MFPLRSDCIAYGTRRILRRLFRYVFKSVKNTHFYLFPFNRISFSHAVPPHLAASLSDPPAAPVNRAEAGMRRNAYGGRNC